MKKTYAWQLVSLGLLMSCGQPAPTPVTPDDAKSPAPMGYKLPATGVLDLADLTNFAKLERDFVKPDDFSKGFDDGPLNGRTFVLTLPVSQYSGPSSVPAEWTYDAEKEELTLTIASGDTSISRGPRLTVQNTTEIKPKKKMSNAFGAEIEIEPMETWSIDVGRTDEQVIGVFKKADDPLSFSPEYQSLTWTMKLDEGHAKALVSNLALRLEGTVQRNSSNQTVECSDDHTAPTFDHPTEWDRHECVIQVRLSRVAYVTKDGNVVKEWRDEPEKPKPPTAAPRSADVDAAEEGNALDSYDEGTDSNGE